MHTKSKPDVDLSMWVMYGRIDRFGLTCMQHVHVVVPMNELIMYLPACTSYVRKQDTSWVILTLRMPACVSSSPYLQRPPSMEGRGMRSSAGLRAKGEGSFGIYSRPAGALVVV